MFKLTILILAITFTYSATFAANISLDNLQEINSESTYKLQGKDKHLIFFWATWCSECKGKLKKDLPKLDRKSNVKVLTVNIDTNIKRAKHFINKKNIDLPVLRDPTRSLIRKLNVSAVPHWAVVKKKDNKWKLVDTATAYDAKRIKRALR